MNIHFDAQVSDIAGMAGFDCVWIDREHLAQDWTTLQAHIWAAKSHDMDVVVRVPRGSYSDYIKPIEARRRVAEVAVKHEKFAGIPGAI